MAERRLQPWTKVTMHAHRGEPWPVEGNPDEDSDGGPRIVPGRPRPARVSPRVVSNEAEIPLMDRGQCEIDADLRYPRGMDFPGLITAAAHNLGVEVDVHLHRRRWLRERYDITLRGRRHEVKQVWQRIAAEMSAWNRTDGFPFADRPSRRF